MNTNKVTLKAPNKLKIITTFISIVILCALWTLSTLEPFGTLIAFFTLETGNTFLATISLECLRALLTTISLKTRDTFLATISLEPLRALLAFNSLEMISTFLATISLKSLRTHFTSVSLEMISAVTSGGRPNSFTGGAIQTESCFLKAFVVIYDKENTEPPCKFSLFSYLTLRNRYQHRIEKIIINCPFRSDVLRQE